MTIPIPVLDDRSFDQLVAEAKARIPVHTPEWTNLNDSDPGITIVELFAFLTENLLYRSNRIPEANRVKFLTMLGISLQPASPGSGLVAFSNDRGPLQPPLALPAGTALQAGQVPFLTHNRPGCPAGHRGPVLQGAADSRHRQTQAQYQLLYQTFLDSSSDVLSFYQPVALPPPATGKPDPVVNLGDPVNGTIDRSLWLAILAPQQTDPDVVRAAIAGQNPVDRRLPRDADAGRGAGAHDHGRTGRRSRAGVRDRRSGTRSVRVRRPGLRDRSGQLRPAADHLRRPGPGRHPAWYRSPFRPTSSSCCGISILRRKAPATTRPGWTTPR